MALNYEALINATFDEVRQSYTRRDAILYGLGIGLGHDPLDATELRFVYEDGLIPFPTMAGVLGAIGGWTRDPRFGIDWVKVLHGEESLEIFRPLPPDGTIIGVTRIADVIDRGPGRGALILQQRDVSDAASGELLARRTATLVARGDGGCGGSGNTPPANVPAPDRSPDIAVDIVTRPEAALIFRLSGDYNPVHADPMIAGKAGFDGPILHGLCTYAIGARALVKALCKDEPNRLKRLSGRFTSPVYPGETIRTDIWRDGTSASFRQKVVERDRVVVDFGRAEFH